VILLQKRPSIIFLIGKPYFSIQKHTGMGGSDNSYPNTFRRSVTLSLICSTDRVDLPAQVPCSIST
jgi:hypothetical protein